MQITETGKKQDTNKEEEMESELTTPILKIKIASPKSVREVVQEEEIIGVKIKKYKTLID